MHLVGPFPTLMMADRANIRVHSAYGKFSCVTVTDRNIQPPHEDVWNVVSAV